MAGLELFAERGFAQTSIAQIASKAQVAKGTVYLYFSSKDDLLLQIFDMLESVSDNFLPEPEGNEDPKALLKMIIEESIVGMRQQTGFFRMIAQLSLQSDVIEGLSERINSFRQGKLSLFTPLFEQLGYEDPEGEMFFLGAAMDGMILGIHSMGEEYPIDKIKDKIQKHYEL